jgi:hypothetical protein
MIGCSRAARLTTLSGAASSPVRRGSAGGSTDDYDSMNAANLVRSMLKLRKLRWIVVDKQNIWLMDPNATVFQAASAAVHKPRVDVGCHRAF